MLSNRLAQSFFSFALNHFSEFSHLQTLDKIFQQGTPRNRYRQPKQKRPPQSAAFAFPQVGVFTDTPYPTIDLFTLVRRNSQAGIHRKTLRFH